MSNTYSKALDTLAEAFVLIRNARLTQGQIDELKDRCRGLIEELDDKVPAKK